MILTSAREEDAFVRAVELKKKKGKVVDDIIISIDIYFSPQKKYEPLYYSLYIFLHKSV